MPRELMTACLTLLATLCLGGTASAQNGPVPVPPFLFPIAQGAQWEDTFGAPRTGHTHLGQDLMAPKMRPLIACFAGTVTLRSNQGSAGNWITLHGTGASTGWRAEYMHLNNDTPGTNDGLGGDRYAFAPGLKSGDSVMAGQFLGFVGNSGNAEAAGSHCHFELHGPDGPVNCAIMLRTAKILPGPQIVQMSTGSTGSTGIGGLLRVVGTVLTVFPDQAEVMVRVTSITEFGGKPALLDPPVVKRLVFSDRESLASLVKDVPFTAEGRELGPGKTLQVEQLTTLGIDPGVPDTTAATPSAAPSVRSTRSAPVNPAAPSVLAQSVSGTAIIDNFERGVYQKWEMTGDCWGRSPELISDRLPVPGTSGRYFLSTAHPRSGDNRPASGTGTAMSSEIMLTQPKLRFRIGGGIYPDECCLNLLVNGKVVRTETGSGTDRLLPAEWDIAEFVGKKARLQIVDKRDSGLRAYILLDELEMAPAGAAPAVVEANADSNASIVSTVPALAALATAAEQTADRSAFVLLPDGTRVEGTLLMTMEATGYGPGENGPWGDRTALGTKVGYGTVAVDPSVIPLRTHLWVEGYGFCIALDKGSAIKGMKIDLGHDSDAEAATVGREKRRVLVLD
ncbi:MAG: 3D domain-containing protein [Armatimonadota bacterium]